jgi:hypothetical protein
VQGDASLSKQARSNAKRVYLHFLLQLLLAPLLLLLLLLE